jgi:hypothetical protein
MNRMKLWREKKKSQEAGRLTQVCVWTPEAEADLSRSLCARVAEPSERGSALRARLFAQLERRRTIGHQWQGVSAHVELDYPLVGPWWFMKNIGGRVIGPTGTHVELSAEEADDLGERLRRCCQREVEAWLEEHKLLYEVRDHTGVVTGSGAPKDANRPADEAAFAANEARIAKAIMERGFASRKPPFNDPSIIQYEGISAFPSFCQIVHRRQGNRSQFAVIHMPNGGTSPTNMIESLATFLRQKFYPEIDAGLIDWFDVRPAETYFTHELNIASVVMEHANGVYSDPKWHDVTDNLAPDWLAMIEETINKARAARRLAEGTKLESTEELASKQKSRNGAKRR